MCMWIDFLTRFVHNSGNLHCYGQLCDKSNNNDSNKKMTMKDGIWVAC